MRMYVRYLGTKVCWTADGGASYIGSREELTEEERKLCEAGGGYLPLSASVAVLAR